MSSPEQRPSPKKESAEVDTRAGKDDKGREDKKRAGAFEYSIDRIADEHADAKDAEHKAHLEAQLARLNVIQQGKVVTEEGPPAKDSNTDVGERKTHLQKQREMLNRIQESKTPRKKKTQRAEARKGKGDGSKEHADRADYLNRRRERLKNIAEREEDGSDRQKNFRNYISDAEKELQEIYAAHPELIPKNKEKDTNGSGAPTAEDISGSKMAKRVAEILRVNAQKPPREEGAVIERSQTKTTEKLGEEGEEVPTIEAQIKEKDRYRERIENTIEQIEDEAVKGHLKQELDKTNQELEGLHRQRRGVFEGKGPEQKTQLEKTRVDADPNKAPQAAEDFLNSVDREAKEKGFEKSVERVGNWYKKLPLTAKLAFAGSLGIGAVAFPHLSVPIAIAATGQRFLGGLATYVGVEALLRQSKEKGLSKRGKERIEDGEGNNRLLNRYPKAYAAVAGIFVASGAVGATSDWLVEQWGAIFGGADVPPPEKPVAVAPKPIEPSAPAEPPPPIEAPTQPLTNIHEVQPGESVWKIMENDSRMTELFKGLSVEQRAYMLDAIKDKLAMMSPEEIKTLGIGSGDINKIFPGEKINLGPLLNNEATLNELRTNAQGLTEKQIEGIKKGMEIMRQKYAGS